MRIWLPLVGVALAACGRESPPTTQQAQPAGPPPPAAHTATMARLDQLAATSDSLSTDALANLGGRLAYPWRRHRQQQVPHRPVVMALGHHLAHHAEPAAAHDGPAVRRELTGDDPQQRGLAGPIGTNQGNLRTLADAEGDVVEQHPPVGQLEPDAGQLHMSHDSQV